MKIPNEKKKIVIANFHNILSFPPVISLVANLLNNGHYVYLISGDVKALQKEILEHPNLKYSNIPLAQNQKHGVIDRLRGRWNKTKYGKNVVKEYMKNADILWTTTDVTLRILGKEVLKYKHVMQLMELEQWFPIFGEKIRIPFPIDMYARKAWKVVVPEINRAYIQKAWWQLEKLPYVLPNKPYISDPGEELDTMKISLKQIRSERKKIILYLGLMFHDRNFTEFAKAVEKLGDEYCLYFIGRIGNGYQQKFNELLAEHSSIKYLGNYPAPKHLLFVKYAYIGLLPYVPSEKVVYRSPLNALYCAPNKIFEYAKYGVPMVGTDVMGLRQPFEQYNIGVCSKELTPEAIAEAIQDVEAHHDEMSVNCKKFFESVDLDEIVEKILYEEA